MINISFDNPYLLLIIIPILLLIIVPFAFAVRKENKSKSTTASLVLHLFIALCIALAIAGSVLTAVITKTEVYVVADVSYSSNRNLDKIDEYVEDVSDKLPRNSKLGVVCFGKDQTLLTELGGKLTSVKNAEIDESATDISSALEYTASLFGGDCLKRIVLITDGKDTDTDATRKLISTIEKLHSENIAIDAVYIDNNITPDVKEVQLTGVDFTRSTYLNHEVTADVLVQSNQESNAIAKLYQGESEIDSRALTLTRGYNVFSFDLPTVQAGAFDYTVKIISDDDTLPVNNAYSFTQNVTGEINVLLVTSNQSDVDRAKALYGDGATIDSFVITKKKRDVPCSVEELCKYDEIILSDVDIRDINNYTAFIDAVDKSVSLFGKSLVTMGDLKIQNKTEDILKQLEDMLPVKFGNSDQDPKLYAIVIDSSRSLQHFSRLIIAKQAAVQLLDFLGENDYVMVVNFWGEINVLQSPIRASDSNKETLTKKINSIEPYQGTVIGTALDKAGDFMIDLAFDEKQIMLISDGLSYTLDSDTPADVVARLREHGITTSVIQPAPPRDPNNTNNADESDAGVKTLRGIASAGGGKYYSINTEKDLEDVMFSEIADDVTESIIEKQTAVKIKLEKDKILSGISSLPDIYGYAYAKAKASASTVLALDYVKSSGSTVEVPLYAYWSYGEGKVASFTSSLSGDWTSLWNGGSGDIFFTNVSEQCTPKERVGYPYTLNVEYDGTYSTLEIIPASLNPSASADATVTLPDGSKITERLTFDSSRYFYKFETPTSGKYLINIIYSFGEQSFEASSEFNISYSPEYDAFAVFDPSSLHAAIRTRGTVSESGVPEIKNDEDKIATYTLPLTAPLMALAVLAYIADIIIRKLKISDIKSFFKIRSKQGGVK
ncbi:MAG: VWA domain-containing protein [Ruminococcaceae bacterium]|nr:VWA domain-containing protein [Oscillospiraceae bacterium]